ncbi:MAG: tetratricopeptide repeat protein [Thermosynechococcaceae cyanobacterium]
MTQHLLHLRSHRTAWFLGSGLLLAAAIWSLWQWGPWTGPRNAYRYPFERSERGQITQDLNREMAFYRDRLQHDPDGGLNRASLAQTYLKMARATGETSWYLLAEQTAQDSLAKLSFDNDGALLALARVNLAKHDFNAAIRMAKQVQDTDSALPTLAAAYLATGNVTAARQAVDTLAAQTPNLGALTLRGLVQLAQGQDGAAIADFQRAIALEEAGETGGSVYTRTLLGRLYFKRGQLQQAEQLYRESLRVLPDYAPARLNLAELEVRQGQYDAADQTYNQFLFTARKTPTVYDHVALRGIIRVKTLQGKVQEAEQWRDRAERRLRQDMATFGHQRELAQLLLERGQPQDLREALTLIEAEAQVRRDSETFSTLAKVLAKLGRWSDARQAMALALVPGIRDAGLFRQMAQIEAQLDHATLSQDWMQRAKQIDPAFDQRAENAQGLGVGLLGLN